MNETLPPDSASAVSWPTDDHRLRTPDTSMSPGSERALPAAVDLHDTPLVFFAAAFALGILIALIALVARITGITRLTRAR